MTEKQIAARIRLKKMFSSSSNIEKAKEEGRKRYAKAYMIENREHYTLLQRNYYRKRNGIPLDAPVMTPVEAAANARKVQKQKREAP